MTAICGIFKFGEISLEENGDRLLASLTPYGRDDARSWCDFETFLGRSLSIVAPEDRLDEQPIITASGRYAIVADVFLTERERLANELGLANPHLLSDSAIAAAAVERWDEGAFDRIYGSFAIAVWDLDQRRLILARDPIGQRPLFHHHNPDFCAFASMPAALHALPDVPRGADTAEMMQFLSLNPSASARSFYEGIERVMPGHYVIIDKAGVRSQRYWHPDLTPLRLSRHEDYVDELRAHLDAAVAACLRGSKNGVAAHLSAGFDSSAVAATAAALLAKTGEKITAFTAVPTVTLKDRPNDYRMLDEGPLAAATAALHENMDHVLVRTDGDVMTGLDRASTAYGRPILNICNYAWAEAISAAVRQRGLKILLTGHMGNATISETGSTSLPELFARGRFVAWFRMARDMVRNKRTRWRGAVWNTVVPWVPIRAWHWGLRVSGWPAQFERARFTALKGSDLHATQRALRERGRTSNVLERTAFNPVESPQKFSLRNRLSMLAADHGSYHKGMLGAWGIDSRDPTADRRLVEFSLRVPVEQHFHKGEPRSLLRKVLSGRVPALVLDNRRRGYQGADWYVGVQKLRTQLAEEIERIERFAPSEALIDVARMKRLLAEWPDGSWQDRAVEADYRHALLRGISAAHFMRKAAGSNY